MSSSIDSVFNAVSEMKKENPNGFIWAINKDISWEKLDFKPESFDDLMSYVKDLKNYFKTIKIELNCRANPTYSGIIITSLKTM